MEPGLLTTTGVLLLDAAYFKIPNKTDVPAIAAAMKKYLPVQNNARQDWKVSGFNFISIRENASLYDVIQSNSLFHRPSDAAAYGAFITAILILLCTCLNFSNTTVARYNGRLKEIGIRKVMGGTQRQLIVQMLLECSVMVFAAILLSALLNHYWLPCSITCSCMLTSGLIISTIPIFCFSSWACSLSQHYLPAPIPHFISAAIIHQAFSGEA
jgi:ABC-type antimicrobial peptide transport system permease subunit